MSQTVQLKPRRSLSPAQQLIWTSQRLEPDAPHQNMALVTRFTESIEPNRFLDAVDAVVARSDALCTIVKIIDGVPHPTRASSAPAPCKIDRVEPDDLDAWVDNRICSPLDLSEAAYESVLVDLGNGDWAWFVNVHHLVIDAASSENFFHAVAAEYEDRPVELPLYEKVVSDLLSSTKPERVDRAREYWKGQLAGSATQLYASNEGLTTAAERVHIDMSSGRQAKLDQFLAQKRFSLISPELSRAVALALMTASYLARLGNDTVTIGVPIHHRSTKESKKVIGPLVELFPLRVEIAPDDSFASLHAKIGREFFKLLSNAHPGTSPRQDFDVVLNVQTATLGSFGSIGASTTWVHPGHIDPHHQLRVQALDYDGTGVLELALDINHRAANAEQRSRAGGHMARVLDALLADPDQSVHSVSLLGEAERALMASFNAVGPGVPIEQNIPGLIEQRLSSEPARPSVKTDDGTVLTAGELDSQIEHFADRLTKAGYGPGDLIGVEIGVSLEAVIAIHGIQRAGAAFVPIDPDYPQARREYLRQDSGCAVVVSSTSDFDDLPVVAERAARAEAASSDLAYVIYTSGSTGLPKGVPITYGGLAEYLGFARDAYVGNEAPTMPLFTSLSFDLTITTLFLPLVTGGLMTIHASGGLSALREIVERDEVTLMKATPSHLELLVKMLGNGSDSSLSKLSALIVGGEAFMTDLADRVIEVCSQPVEIYNEYGPTEAVVGCMIHRYDPAVDLGPPVPIGRPAPGVELNVFDPYGIEVPIGASGELYIRRPAMTSGYLGRDDLNSSKFVELDSGTIYRTGDLVRLTNPETMVYLGRIDEQIKVGGVRLEPGEIEHLAREVPGVQNAVARLWSPQQSRSAQHCIRCGLPSDVPEIEIDEMGVCSSCHQFDAVAPQADEWFKTEDDLRAALADARARSAGDYDVIHLISGGKDSTYALYKLVELGARVFAITLDNGFLAEEAIANAKRATTALGVDHEMVTVDGMNEIFRDSLERFSNVCNGCYKAIYTVALAKAEELGVRSIVTGLSRGQFFETRLVPGMFGADRFDPDAIDEMVREARRAYHATPDAVAEQMDVDFLQDETIFDRITFIDLYRYVDVPLSELYETLDKTQTWKRPPDSGRSTNCLINAAGIYVHKMEQGHHNYAVPYSWDVRLGHKTREEALFELDDPMNDRELAAITSMLAEVGYEPQKPETLTLWIEVESGVDVDVEDIRTRLAADLPAHGVPRAIEIVEEIPLTTNGKVDTDALPAPARWRTNAPLTGQPVEGKTELRIAAIWKAVLGLPEVTATDDFFSLGGTSLHALEMIVRVSDSFDLLIPESVAFKDRTIGQLATYIENNIDSDDVSGRTDLLHIPELPVNGPLPLSAGEEAMLYEWRRDPDDVRYNVARLYNLSDTIDQARLDDAIKTVVEHHPTLTTSYGVDRRQLATAEALDISSTTNSLASLEQLAESLNRSTFDLVHGPLITVHHLQGNDRNARGLLIRTHHIVSDAGSLDVLWEQIDQAYRGQDLPQPDASYAAHGQWQASRPSDPAALWSPTKEVANLVLRGPGNEPDGYVHRSANISATQLRKAPAPTLFGNALAALAAAVRAAHDGPSIELTITSSVRDHPAVADVVGYFLNPMPLVIDVDPQQALGQLAESVGDQLANALVHRSVSWRSVVSSAAERGIEAPTGQVMLAIEDLAPAYLDGAEVEHTILASGTAVNDLTFFVQVRGELVEIGVEYRGSTVGRQAASRLLDTFSAALDTLVESPARFAGTLGDTPEPLLGEEILINQLPAPALIAESIRQDGNADAVRCGEQSLTYSELDMAGRRIAARLRAVGVEEGDRVALCMPRSVDLIASIWGIWLVGASYVPLDPAQPDERLAALTSAAGVRAAVAAGEPKVGLRGVPTVLVDQPDAAVLPLATGLAGELGDQALDREAYLIFTSGSTGVPKGVPISHRNLAASLAARRQFYDESVERYLLMSSAGFDSSVAGIFWALADGGQLVLPTEVEAHDVDALGELISGRAITHTLMVPSLYGAMLERNPKLLTSLSTVIVAGEACPPSIVKSHFANVAEANLVNEYGPTEATVWATAHRCEPNDAETSSVPIGGPIPGVGCEVLGADGRAVAIDVAGELVLTGPGVSTGYIDGPSSSFFDGRSWTYRTGDLVVRRSSGLLDFVGRIDDQLSIGGVRIDPSEVESALGTIDGVGACLVTRGGRGLVAFVEPTLSNGAPTRSPTEIRRAAMTVLPATHVPTVVNLVEALPRNINGKLDRGALDSITLDKIEVVGESAATIVDDAGMTGKIADIFSRAFDGAIVQPDSDFFDLGGDSLHAVAVVSMIESELGQRVAIGELIASPTPSLLAKGMVATGTSKTADTTDRADLVEWLRSTGSERPLIVFPPGGGNLLRYGPLVRALDQEIPVVGVRLPGADARTEIVETIEKQAAVMLDALDTAVPSGPYLLLGWSTGGLLAWEISRLLTERGDDVEAVVLVDTVMAGLRVDDAGTIKDKYQTLLKSEGVRSVVGEATGRLTERASFAFARRRYRTAREAGETPTAIDAERQLGPVIRRAALNYTPTRQDVRVLYVSASESENEVTLNPWQNLQGDAPLEVITVDGAHFLPEERCILGPEKAPDLVKALVAQLLSE